MSDELLRQCIDDIIQQAESAKKDTPGELRDGQLLAYNEILSILRTNLTPLGPEKYGLGFDIDKRLA